MKYKAIIFDLDGVICHTDQYHYQAWKALADRLGIYFDKEINNRLRGVSRMESLDIILERSETALSPEEKEALTEEKNTQYIQMLDQMSAEDLAKETKETLDELRRRGMKLAIGSSSKNAVLILSRLGLEGYFDAIADGTQIGRSKPDPEVFQKAAQHLGVEASDCLVVEDAVAGIQAAQAAGMDSAAIAEAALSGLATYRLGTFSDLLQVTKE